MPHPSAASGDSKLSPRIVETLPTRRISVLALLWLALFAVYAATAAEDWHSPDVTAAELGARQIATTGTPWVDGLESPDYYLSAEMAQGDPSKAGRLSLFSTINERNGHTVVTRTPGVIAAGIPAYWVESLVGTSTSEELSAIPGALTAAALTATAVLLLMLSVVGLVPTRLVIGATAAVALATPLWSVAADALWTHSVTVIGIAGMAWACRRERWWLVGVFGGVGLWGRLHVVVIVAVLGVGIAIWRKRPVIAVMVAATSLPFLGGLFIWGHWFYGSWSFSAATGGYPQYSSPGAVSTAFATSNYFTNAAGYLFSPGAGLLVWTPVLLVLTPAVVRKWSVAPDWCRVMAAGGLTYLLIQASLNRFHGGTGFWGNRLDLEVLACLFPLMTVAARYLQPWERRLAVIVVGYQAGVVALGAVFDLALTRGFAWRQYDPYLAFEDNAAVTLTVIAMGVAVSLLSARGLGTSSLVPPVARTTRSRRPRPDLD